MTTDTLDFANNKVFQQAQQALKKQKRDAEQAAAGHYRARQPAPVGTKLVTGVIIGRNKVIVPPDEVEHLASVGCSDTDIARYFGITDSVLRYQLSEYLIKGRHRLKLSLRQAQLRVALEGNPTMLIWMGKNCLQQSDNGAIDNSDTQALPWTEEFDQDIIDDDEDDESYGAPSLDKALEMAE